MTYFSSKVGVNIPYCTDFNANQRSKFTYFQHIYKSRTAITGFTACSIASSYRYQQLLVRMIKYIMYTHGSPSICTYLHRFRTRYMSANSNKFAFRNHSAIVEQLSFLGAMSRSTQGNTLGSSGNQHTSAAHLGVSRWHSRTHTSSAASPSWQSLG